MTYRLAAWRLAVQALVAVMVGACAGGGGGGGGGSVISPPPPPPVSPPGFPPLSPPHAPGDFPNLAGAEFNANWGVAGTNAQIAWQNGATGAGVLVGVIDDGIHPTHPELTGRISPNSTDIVAGRNALTTDFSHGSELSSLIAGNYNNSQTVGVAFDATILAVRADDGSGSFGSIALANAINYARQQNVRVINLSLGSATPSPQVMRDAISAATQAGIIVVVSAGNDGNSGATDPNYPGFLATDASVSNGLIIVAGGLNPNGSVNPASNPPGSAANFYMTAPGWQIIVPDYGPPGAVPGFQVCGLGSNGDLCRIQGTSYASPHVTGAVALLMDAFPGITPNQVVDLLFTTADDTGAPGTDAVNGRGRLNIGRAFQPVGPLAIPLMAGEPSLFEDTPLGVVGPAFGDGISRNAAWLVAGFDRYQRTFSVDLGNNWLSPTAAASSLTEAPRLWRNQYVAPGVELQMSLADSVVPESYRLPLDQVDLERSPARVQVDLPAVFSMTLAVDGARDSYRADPVSHLDLVDPDISLAMTRRFNDTLSISFMNERGVGPDAPALSVIDMMRAPSERSASAARASFELGSLGFDVLAGQLDEQRGILGLSWSDAFGSTPAGQTRFAGLGLRYESDRPWGVSFNAELGAADLAQTSWLSVDETLRTSSYAGAFTYDWTPQWLANAAGGGHGVLRLSISQPLRVESGALSFMAPTANKYGRSSLQYEVRTFEPTPSGREVRFGASYSYFADDVISAFGEASYISEPGHVENADPAAMVRIGVRIQH